MNIQFNPKLYSSNLISNLDKIWCKVGNLIITYLHYTIVMSKQNCSMEQSVDSDEKFENVENAVLAVFRLLKEYDRLVEIAETKIEKIGGETYG